MRVCESPTPSPARSRRPGPSWDSSHGLPGSESGRDRPGAVQRDVISLKDGTVPHPPRPSWAGGGGGGEVLEAAVPGAAGEADADGHLPTRARTHARTPHRDTSMSVCACVADTDTNTDTGTGAGLGQGYALKRRKGATFEGTQRSDL